MTSGTMSGKRYACPTTKINPLDYAALPEEKRK
jgi:hypothetical protein